MSIAQDQVGVVGPRDAWSALESGNAALIDVRTRAEWTFVGVPDLSQLGQQAAFIEWQSFPTMDLNETFTDAALRVAEQSGCERLYFLCRSGARSLHAATATSAALAQKGHAITCFNVAEGFEGDVDHAGHRGQINGWKAHQLPWRQG